VAQVLDLVEDRIDARINHEKGALSTEGVRTVMEDLHGLEDTELLYIINEGWAQLCYAVEEAQWRDERRHPLERLIISHFAPMLAPRGSAPLPGGNLSRRAIPGFLAALHQMIGKELLNDYEERCREIVDEIQSRAGDRFEWQMVYNDDNANILAQDIIVYIAQYFRDIPKRRVWMIDIFARNMPAPQDEAERAWRFGNEEFHLLVGGLYAEIFMMLKNADDLSDLRTRYGDDRLSALVDVEHALEQDRAVVL